MKNYRMLVPIALIGLLAVSWFKLISNVKDTQNEYNTYLEEARAKAELGITTKAIENYELALEMNPTLEIYQEVADYYKERGQRDSRISWCENMVTLYPTNSGAYDYLLAALVDEKDYEACYDIIEAAEKRGVTSSYMKEVYDEMAYFYTYDFNTYDEVGIFSNNYCSVKTNDGWGFVDRYGKLRISCRYEEVGSFTKTNFASVVNKQGEAYFVDKSGAKMLATKEEYQKFGLLVGEIMTAQKIDQKYVYLNDNFKVLFGDYDYASSMNGGIAAVKNGDEWSIINSSGETVTDTKYRDVKLDEKEIAYRNERLFVSNGEGYILIDSSGKQIGNQVYEDAKVFSDSTYTAVKIDGKWCFIDKSGKRKSDKTYAEARGYVNGLAAVNINGKWGFVNQDEEIVIENEFNDAKDFNEKGSCFVKLGEEWQLIKLYRLNR